MNHKYLIETYGCQMNKAESDALEIELQNTGWSEADAPEKADLVIINTCSVRKTAEDRIYGRIGFYKKIKETVPHIKLIITGCMAERLGDRLMSNNSPVDKVFGTFEKNQIIDYITFKNPVNSIDNTDIYEFSNLHYKAAGFKAFVPIMHGCNNYCSYCIVPYVRGREISRNHESVLEEIVYLENKGVKEITLLGQNVNSYKYENNKIITHFPGLLEIISKKISSIEWIRFLTSHPKDLDEKTIDIIAENRIICRHIHLPVQSGSEKILKLMNRKYTPEDYIRLLEKIKKAMPDISITTDLIAGFPGETDADFQETLNIMKTADFSDAFTYYYNPREGTAAYDIPDSIPLDIKLERLNQLINLQKDISFNIKNRKIGNTVKILAETLSKKNKNEILGRTENDEMIVFSGNYDKIGKFHNVRIVSLKGNTFRGELL